MSLILDALKKSELERRGQATLPRRPTPKMDEMLEGPKPTKRPKTTWPLTFGAFAAACLLSAGVTYHLLRPAEPPTPQIADTAPVADTDITADVDETVAPPNVPLVNEDDALSLPTQLEQTAEIPAIIDDSQPPTIEFVEADPPPTSREVVVIYAADPDKRSEPDSPVTEVASPPTNSPTDEGPEPAAPEIQTPEQTILTAVGGEEPTLTAPEIVVASELETDLVEPHGGSNTSAVSSNNPIEISAEVATEPDVIDEVASINPTADNDEAAAPSPLEPQAEDIIALPAAGRKPAPPARSTQSRDSTTDVASLGSAADDAVSLYQRAAALEREGLFDRAIETYTAAILARPNFIEAYYGRAWAHLGNESFDEAIRNFDRVIEINDGMAEAYFGRAWALERDFRYEAAIRNYSEAIDRAPGKPALAFNRAILRLYTNDFTGADSDFMDIRRAGNAAEQDFAVLWAFVARARNGAAPNDIFPALRDAPANTDWPGRILDYFFGRVDQDAVLKEAGDAPFPTSAERLTVAHYFIGQRYLMTGNVPDAANAFRLAVAEGARGVRQYWAARLELDRLGIAY